MNDLLSLDDTNKFKRLSFLLIDHLDRMRQQIYESVDESSNSDGSSNNNLDDHSYKSILCRLHTNVNELLLQCAMVVHPNVNQEQASSSYLCNPNTGINTSVHAEDD